MPTQFSVESPVWLLVAAGAVVLAILVLSLRATRPTNPAARAWCAVTALGALLLGAALANVGLVRQPDNDVLVMLDLSQSTRGAAFRDEASLRRRLNELLGARPVRIVTFADDVESGGTVFTPEPGASTIVLFSDGQFTAPRQPTAAVFPVIDPLLERLVDARITDVQPTDGGLLATVENGTGPRRVRASTGAGGWLDVPEGISTVRLPAPPRGSELRVELDRADDFPENDVWRWRDDGGAVSRRVWVGEGALPVGFERVAPGALREPMDLLNARIVVVADTPITALPQSAQAALDTYVRRFGGGLILTGGTRAFAAGGWTGSRLDALSPLASTPPEPRRLWLLIVDASGSMTAAAGDDGGSRWQRATAALTQLTRTLPPDDLVLVGAFARELRWFDDTAIPARDAAERVTAPSDLIPRGPTNLESALRTLSVDRPRSGLPRVAVVLTDGETPLDDPKRLAGSLRDAGVTLLILGVGDQPVTAALTQLAERTGGRVTVEPDAGRWGDAAAVLARAALQSSAPRPFNQTARFTHPRDLIVSPGMINLLWPREGATLLAGDDDAPLAAVWAVGAGRVVAVAFAPDDALLGALSDEFASLPQDDRIRVAIQDKPAGDSMLHLTVSSADGSPVNRMRWILRDDTTEAPLAQVAPGRYSAPLAFSANPRVVEVVDETGGVLRRVPVEGRYPPEFARLGINRAVLVELTRASGGEVIESDRRSPLSLPSSAQSTSLRPWLAGTAAVVLLAGLLLATRR